MFSLVVELQIIIILFYAHWCSGCTYDCVSDPPGNGIVDSCELPRGCWELDPSPLEEQHTVPNC